MASKVIVLALVFAAIVGLASAAELASSTTVLPAEAPLSNDFIGTDDAGAPSGGDGAVVPGPVESVDAAGGPSGSPASGSAALKFSAITGVAAAAGYLFF